MKNKLSIIKRFFLLLLVIHTQSVNAQHAEVQDYSLVKLNDGSKLKAKSVELTDDAQSYLLILNIDKELEIKASDVKKVKLPKHVWEANKKGQLIPIKGKYTQIMIGVNGNTDDENKLSVGLIPFQYSMGLQFNPKISVGAGFSLDTYNRRMLMPFFLEGKYFLTSHLATSLYLGLRAGIGPNFSWNHSGGGMLHPHIGLRSSSKFGQQFVMEFGVKMQQQHRRFRESVQRTTFNRYTFSFGIMF